MVTGDVFTIRHDEVKEGWEQWYLLQSDVHWDNPHCDRKLFHKHLKQAKERNAGIMIFGDFFCAMQGKWDKRSNKESLRPEHRQGNYFDSLVNTAADDLADYAPLFKVIARGNHEMSVEAHHETDLIDRLCKRLNIQAGGYAGFVRFLFTQGGSDKTSHSLFWHHGSGGGGPVTKGVIGTNRKAVWLPDPTFVVSGHIHEEWVMTMPRLRLSQSGKMYQDEQIHVTTATYKQEFHLNKGFHIERGRAPKPLGGAWLRFYFDSSQRGHVGYEVTRAK